MDWAARRLADEPVTEATYTDDGVLATIADGQRRYYDAGGNLEVPAEAYGLGISEEHDWRYLRPQFYEEEGPGGFGEGQFKEHLYYVMVERRNGAPGHGFAMDCRDANEIRLADVGSGTYRCPGMSAKEVVQKHIEALNSGIKKEEKPSDPDTRINAVYALKLERRTD